MTAQKKQITIACAMIIHEGKICIAPMKHENGWEFPWTVAETADAFIEKMDEQLHMNIQAVCRCCTVIRHYQAYDVKMKWYLCSTAMINARLHWEAVTDIDHSKLVEQDRKVLNGYREQIRRTEHPFSSH